eukprot:Skav230287  [mRNA]  locus=scaffold2934:13073:13834:- [translate_table: standard]
MGPSALHISIVLTWQMACAMCSALIEAKSVHELPKLLQKFQVTEVFLDLDETIVMPDTPFIFGMPGSDRFVANLDPCLKAAMPQLLARMEASYYAAPLQLVDPALPEIIAKINDEMRVLLLTSRHTGVAADYEAHNFRVIDFLAAARVEFSRLAVGVGNDTAIGGIIFAQGEKINKGKIIKDMLKNRTLKAALVDNTLGKLKDAVAVPDLCLVGIHLTASHQLEQNDVARKRWMCKELRAIQGDCTSCELSEL